MINNLCIWKNYIDYNLVSKTISKVYDIEDIFIIYNLKTRTIEKITNSGRTMLETITRKTNISDNIKNYPEYKQSNIIDFCLTIKKETCKYKTYEQKYTVYKYTILEKLYNKKISDDAKLNSYLYQYEKLRTSDIFKKYFRSTKLKNVLQ